MKGWMMIVKYRKSVYSMMRHSVACLCLLMLVACLAESQVKSTVESYLNHLADGRYADAHELLRKSDRKTWKQADYTQMMQSLDTIKRWAKLKKVSFSITEVVVEENRAKARVESQVPELSVTQILGVSEDEPKMVTQTDYYTLVKEDGDWRIDLQM
jgi:hypothetical protein